MPHFPIRFIVVHYSATPRGRPVTVEEIDGWHKARGWKGIGYHYVIYLDGSVHKGRPDDVVGAHVANHNTGALGICWIGGTDNGKSADTRTPAQTASLIALIKRLLAEHPGAQVLGHRDMPGAATECPGFDVKPWWASVVRAEFAPVPGQPPTPTNAPVQPGHDAPAPETAGDPSRPATGSLTPSQTIGAGTAIALGAGAAVSTGANGVGLWIGVALAIAAVAFVAFRIIRSRKE